MTGAKEDRKRQSRERALESAARLYRQKGVSGAGIAEIMKEAGLTHGGFYAHFPDKTAFVDAAFERAMDQSRERWMDGHEETPAAEKLDLLVRRYLSRDHRDDQSRGCPIPAIGADIGRGAPDGDSAAERSISATLHMLETQLACAGADDQRAARTRAIALLALCAGGVTLARCVQDEMLVDQILRACRAEARGLVAGRPTPIGEGDAGEDDER